MRIKGICDYVAGLDRSRSCPEQLQIPKVAMMFLTQGPMPHEELWKRWLASIAGFIPTLCLANAVCGRGGLPVRALFSSVHL